jgi:hypothetical protein
VSNGAPPLNGVEIRLVVVHAEAGDHPADLAGAK